MVTSPASSNFLSIIFKIGFYFGYHHSSEDCQPITVKSLFVGNNVLGSVVSYLCQIVLPKKDPKGLSVKGPVDLEENSKMLKNGKPKGLIKKKKTFLPYCLVFVTAVAFSAILVTPVVNQVSYKSTCVSWVPHVVLKNSYNLTKDDVMCTWEEILAENEHVPRKREKNDKCSWKHLHMKNLKHQPNDNNKETQVIWKSRVVRKGETTDLNKTMGFIWRNHEPFI